LPLVCLPELLAQQKGALPGQKRARRPQLRTGRYLSSFPVRELASQKACQIESSPDRQFASSQARQGSQQGQLGCALVVICSAERSSRLGTVAGNDKSQGAPLAVSESRTVAPPRPKSPSFSIFLATFFHHLITLSGLATWLNSNVWPTDTLWAEAESHEGEFVLKFNSSTWCVL